jgi:hypothetical protein
VDDDISDTRLDDDDGGGEIKFPIRKTLFDVDSASDGLLNNDNRLTERRASDVDNGGAIHIFITEVTIATTVTCHRNILDPRVRIVMTSGSTKVMDLEFEFLVQGPMNHVTVMG